MKKRSFEQVRTGPKPSWNFALIQLLAALGLFALIALPAAALATEGPEGSAPRGEVGLEALRDAQAAHAVSLGAQLTDAQAATELPHRDLGRAEALTLLEEVFEPALQTPAGNFDSLDVKHFLSNNAAIVYPPADESVAVSVGGKADSGHAATPALLESTLPLRVQSPEGSTEAVDLSLERADGQIRSAAPVEPVAIPQELGEGIELPGSGIEIELVGAPKERSPSIIEESVAAYPNVDTDTDLAVAPTSTGVETLTSLRSADAPHSQTFRLELPAGASLIEGKEGVAEVLQGGQELLRVLPPTAIDATGARVPVSMTVAGDTLTVTTSPKPGAAYPILVDPLYEGFAWKTGATPNWAGWDPWTYTGTIIPGFGENWGAGWKGAYIEAQANYYGVGAQAGWTHTVPRLAEEEAKGTYPTSYIGSFVLEGLYFETSAGLPSPFLFGGIYNPTTLKWVTGSNGQEAVWSWPGNASWVWGNLISFDSGPPGKRDQHAYKAFGMSLAVSEAGWLASPRASFLGAASVEIDDETRPTVGTVTAPSGWMNQTATGPIVAAARDTGLGVKNVTFILPGQGEKTIQNACGGQTQDPCPSSQNVSLPAASYSPASMSQGVNTVSVRDFDVLWNATAEGALGKAQIKVDHTAPTVALSGSLTEQATLGTTLPQYKLKYVAGDGAVGSPQSGVAKTEVKIDGKAAETFAPGCSTENCAITREWTLTASQYSAGSHTIEVITTDGVGLTTTKKLAINLSKDETAPTVNTEGGFFAGPEGWLEQKSYGATIKATDPGGYGLKSLSFKIDGTSVESKSQSCPSGGCEASIAKTMNVALYDGGAHTAEVIATDGAGNTTTKTWTINVDPAGMVSDSEATDTLEALEETEPNATVVTPTTEAIPAEERATGNNPSLKPEGADLISVGVPVKTTINGSPEGNLVVESPEGDIEVSSVTSTGIGAEPTVINDIAALTSNATTGTDAVVRPKYDGALQFQSIREPGAPENFSWEVNLQNGQTLSLVEGGHSAAVYFEDGTEAMLIDAMPASDAVGHEVPTHLSVTEGNVVTLTVEHRGGTYVYPVVAGPAFEVGYVTVGVIAPPPPQPEEEGGEGSELEVSAPEPTTPEEAGITDPAVLSRARFHTYAHNFVMRRCEIVFEFIDPTIPGNPRLAQDFHCGNPFTREPSSPEVAFDFAVRGRFFVAPGEFVSHKGVPTNGIACDKQLFPDHFSDPNDEWTVQPAYFINPAAQCVWWGKTLHGGGSKVGVGEHLTAYGEWNAGKGHTNDWHTYQLGSAVYIWGTNGGEGYRIEKKKTTCIDC